MPQDQVITIIDEFQRNAERNPKNLNVKMFISYGIVIETAQTYMPISFDYIHHPPPKI